MKQDDKVQAKPSSQRMPTYEELAALVHLEDLMVPPELIPNVDNLTIEDGKPMESIYAEKQGRLLTESLYTSWPGPEDGAPFVVLANVGLFYTPSETHLVPDVMLSLNVKGADFSIKENRSYFVWSRGKPPDVVIEIVSDRLGGETTHKMRSYGQMGIPYYVIFDPFERLGSGVLQAFGLHERTYVPLAPSLLPSVGLGLTLWQGKYEDQEAQWLRWCDPKGNLIPTGQERAEQQGQRAEQERQRAEQERQRADRLEAQLRAMGIEPSS